MVDRVLSGHVPIANATLPSNLPDLMQKIEDFIEVGTQLSLRFVRSFAFFLDVRGR